jgi:hypothetical protein|tara:strand:+ start:341 stop:769 length:429 start_codon:yes stop_codon:yes gene_type:complete
MIKIFICDIQKHIFNEELLTKFFIKSDTYKYILSNDGLYKISNDNIYKLIIHDSKYEKKTINKIDLLFDYSTITEKKNYRIPNSNQLLTIQTNIYLLRNKSQLKLYIEKNNNKIYDVYFLADEKLDEYNLNEDINTFLSMVN